jgi:NADPH:quinone reductase-like Zn-dependent oxidoreductase
MTVLKKEVVHAVRCSSVARFIYDLLILIMKRIAIFGATGGVGLHATEIALERGTTDITVLIPMCKL